MLDKPTEITGTDKVTGLRAGDDFYSVKATFVFRASDPLNSFLPGLEIRGRSIMLMIRRKQILKAFLPAVTAQVSRGR